jgi:hypothetical protein
MIITDDGGENGFIPNAEIITKKLIVTMKNGP